MKKFFRRIQYNWDLILLAYIAWIIMPVTMLGMVYLILATLKIGWSLLAAGLVLVFGSALVIMFWAVCGMTMTIIDEWD